MVRNQDDESRAKPIWL